MKSTRAVLVSSLHALLLSACPDHPPPREVKVLAVTLPDGGGFRAKPTYDGLLRYDFNLRAQEHFVPLFWRSDANVNKKIDPVELAVLWRPNGTSRGDYVEPSGFTAAFDEAYRDLTRDPPAANLSSAEKARRNKVRLELSQGRPTLVETDLTRASDEDRALVARLIEAAPLIERLYALQRGTTGLEALVPQDDPASRALFHRNQGPWCEAPKTQGDPECSAIPGAPPKRVFGLYPAALQDEEKFCQRLEAEPNAKALTDHFSVVVREGAGFKAVPYTSYWKNETEAVARALEAAADAITSPGEKSLKAYLTAAAAAFRSNDWGPADEAWVAMSATDSKWYVRIAPDEVYFEPCAWKAGFAFQLGRINLESLEWKTKLDPLKDDMERALAGLAGSPYRARTIQFKLPDFTDVVLNAGDQRQPHGATVGQSLPNWGPVAERGGRTVVMTNLGTDADSRKQLEVQMASLFCAATMAKATTEPAVATMSTVLHEAAHNLGPAHDYQVKGKKGHEAFGGPLASTMEELKAQTSALFFSDWLAQRKQIPAELAEQAHVRAVAWAFGHVSRGMYDGAGRPRTYSQLAAIQLGWLHRAGVLQWHADRPAASGADQGCFELTLGRPWTTAVTDLTRQVLGVKARGDRPAAEKLKADFVDGTGEWKTLRDTITQRWLIAPKSTFVYAIRR